MKSQILRLLSAIFGVWRIGGTKLGFRYLIAILRSLPTIISKRSLNAADGHLSKANGFFKCKIDGHIVIFALRDFGLARELWGQGIYFREAGFGVSTNDRVVDLGANLGVFSVGAAVIGAKVMAVEAQAQMAKLLRDNLHLNNLTDQVRVYQGFVGVPECLRSQGIETGLEVDLEQGLKELGWNTVEFLKADIEGAEFSLFRNSPAWLKRVHRIAMEVHPQFGDPRVLCNDLASAGFTVQLRDKAFQKVEKIVEEVGFCYAWRECRQ